MLTRNDSTLSVGYESNINSSKPELMSECNDSKTSDVCSNDEPLECEKEDESQTATAPAGSVYAWVIVACAGFNMMCTLGIVNSFGIFSTYYINYIFPEMSAAAIAWIGTMMSLFMLGGAVTTGPLTDRFGFKAVSLSGTAICCTALLLASFTHALWQLVVTQGVMFGLGAACIFSPSVSLPAQWHDKTRPLATGIAVAGSGAGGMIFSAITQKMMESLGHKWTLRALSLIFLCISGTSGMFYKQRLVVPQGGTRFMAIAKDPRLILVGMGGLCVNISYFVPWYYLPTAAIKIGQTRQAANNLVVYMNAGSTVGRVVSAYIAMFLGPINCVAVAYYVCAVLVLVVLLAVHQMSAYIALSVIYGALSASFISITPLILANVFGAQAVTTAMGIMNMWCSIGVLIGNPSQGAIYQKYDRPHGSFVAIAIWGFAGIFLAACCYTALKHVVVRKTQHHMWSRL